jgi:hypothetical protein
MQAAEFAQFEMLIRRMEKIFARKPLDDETMQSYWSALKDQSLAVFRKFVERHEKYGKFFPKPMDLRAKPDKLPEVQGSKDDATFKEGEARCIRYLEELKRKDEGAWRQEIGLRHLDRLVATEHPGSSLYEAALSEWHQLRALQS